jgi:hypothetical protein
MTLYATISAAQARVANALSAVRRAENDRTDVLAALLTTRRMPRGEWVASLRTAWWAEARAARAAYKAAMVELRAANGALEAALAAVDAEARRVAA